MGNSIRSFEERQLATFRHEKVERIVWQPRFSDWYSHNHIHMLRKGMSQEELAKLILHCPDIPEEIYGLEHMEVYDYLDASPRYIGEGWPGLGLFHTKANPEVKIEEKWITDKEGNRNHKITTPYGVLTESWKKGSTYPNERILKRREDFKAVLYYVENKCHEMEFQPSIYEIFLEENEGRTVSTASPWRSPYNKCIVELAGTRATMLLMKRYTKEFDAFCDELARINFEVVMPALLKSPIQFVGCGDNVDCRNNPPPVYEKYQLPYFERVAKECRDAGKFTHAHFDGALEDLLPYMGDELYPFDGVEAPTFLPQGDVSTKDFKKALGDKIIVLDGIPSTPFTKYFSEQQFVDCVQEVLETFSPNLILGVSDEFSPNGLFKRLKMVSEMVERFEV